MVAAWRGNCKHGHSHVTCAFDSLRSQCKHGLVTSREGKVIEAQKRMCRPIYLPSLHQLKAEEKGVSRRLIMF
jgi:hypothetical protein